MPYQCFRVRCQDSLRPGSFPFFLWPCFYSFWEIIDSQKKMRGREAKKRFLELRGKYILCLSPSHTSKILVSLFCRERFPSPSPHLRHRSHLCASTTGCPTAGGPSSSTKAETF